MSKKECPHLKWIEDRYKIDNTGFNCERVGCKLKRVYTIRTWPGYYSVCEYHFDNRN